MMKKPLILMLVLLLTLCLAAPAFAFTSDTDAMSAVPYKLNLYLVDYEDNDLFGVATLPASNRGYAKNEIIAAVAELFVPKDEEITTKDYSRLVFGGNNVDLDVADNYNIAGNIDLRTNAAVSDDGNTSTNSALVDDKILTNIISLPGENTYKWLFFAKVTDDDASLYAKLIDGRVIHGDTSFGDQLKGYLFITLYGIGYDIHNTDTGNGDFQYVIYVCDGKEYDGAYIYIDVDEDNVSLGMSIDPYGIKPKRALGVNTKNELGIVVGATIETGDDAEDYLDIYEDIIVDAFGMDYFLIGNYVRDSYFENLISGDTIIATVDIEPWTAYVTVPDNIVMDPPKTGDAASILGFVMVAFSAGGAVALKKRG